jgi:hypothetical protein
MPPLREITPTVFPGIGSLNHSRALAARPPIMPITPWPGLITPNVLGPMKRASCSLALAAMAMASHSGTRSGTSSSIFTPASIASTAAGLTSLAGTKTTEMSISPTLVDRFADGVEDGHAFHILAALAGRAAGDDVGAEFAHELGAGAAFAAGDALHEHAFGSINDDGHDSGSVSRW